MTTNSRHKNLKTTTSGITRREWLRSTGVAIGAGLLVSGTRGYALQQPTRTISVEKWADFVELGDRTWAVVSKPLGGGFDTLCNGGVIAGDARVIAFDTYAQNKGAAWVGNQCETIDRRWPSDVVLSHHHGDHTNGLAGFSRGSQRPKVWCTEATRTTALESGNDLVRKEMLESAEILPTDKATVIDLGGRSVEIVPHDGHTRSDVALVAEDVDTVFFGDLLWNELFPNYVNAIPGKLSASVRTLLEDRKRINVPGHGSLPNGDALDRYVALLAEIEVSARKAHEAGQSAEEATADYKLPESLGSWTLFNSKYFQVAFTAWYRELDA